MTGKDALKLQNFNVILKEEFKNYLNEIGKYIGEVWYDMAKVPYAYVSPAEYDKSIPGIEAEPWQMKYQMPEQLVKDQLLDVTDTRAAAKFLITLTCKGFPEGCSYYVRLWPEIAQHTWDFDTEETSYRMCARVFVVDEVSHNAGC